MKKISLISLFMWLISAIMVVFVLCLILVVVDSSFMPIKQAYGIVTKRYIVGAHTTSTVVLSGKIPVPISTYHPTSYNIEIEINHLNDVVEVSDVEYQQVSIGQRVYCSYTNGSISESLYIESFK